MSQTPQGQVLQPSQYAPYQSFVYFLLPSQLPAPVQSQAPVGVSTMAGSTPFPPPPPQMSLVSQPGQQVLPQGVAYSQQLPPPQLPVPVQSQAPVGVSTMAGSTPFPPPPPPPQTSLVSQPGQQAPPRIGIPAPGNHNVPVKKECDGEQEKETNRSSVIISNELTLQRKVNITENEVKEKFVELFVWIYKTEKGMQKCPNSDKNKQYVSRKDQEMHAFMLTNTTEPKDDTKVYLAVKPKKPNPKGGDYTDEWKFWGRNYSAIKEHGELIKRINLSFPVSKCGTCTIEGSEKHPLYGIWMCGRYLWVSANNTKVIDKVCASSNVAQPAYAPGPCYQPPHYAGSFPVPHLQYVIQYNEMYAMAQPQDYVVLQENSLAQPKAIDPSMEPYQVCSTMEPYKMGPSAPCFDVAENANIDGSYSFKECFNSSEENLNVLDPSAPQASTTMLNRNLECQQQQDTNVLDWGWKPKDGYNMVRSPNASYIFGL